MGLISGLAVIGVVLLAWVCIFKIIPDCMLSMFRYRLWRQRDDLAQDIRDGVFQHKEPALEVLGHIECFIRLAPQLSPLHILLMRLSMAGIETERASWKPDYRGLLEAEHHNLDQRLNRLERTIANHVLLETPTGWATVALGLFALPLALGIEILRDRRAAEPKILIEEARRRASEGSSELAERRHQTNKVWSDPLKTAIPV